MKRTVASVISIRPAVAGSNPPPDQPPASAALAPPQPTPRNARERRANRMIPFRSTGNWVESESAENADITTQIGFLAATCDDIYTRFLRGVSEYEIARTFGGRVHNVARTDVERVVRAGYREERRLRLELERELRRVAA